MVNQLLVHKLVLGSITTAIAASGMITFAMRSAQAATFSIHPIEEDTTGFRELIDEFQQFVQGEGQPFDNPDAHKLDANKLKLLIDHDVRAFFLNEGAGKITNDLLFSATGYTSEPESVFEDISCIADCQFPEPDGGNLNIGDWVDLGLFRAGTSFDFKLRTTNGVDGQEYIYGADPAQNADGLSHLVAYEYKKRIVLGFEDLYGAKGATGGLNESSDRDFNDVVFVVDAPVESVPEPSSILGLAALGLTFAGSKLLRCFKFRLFQG